MEQERYTGHQRIDQRSMAMRRVIAEKLRQCTPFAGVLSPRERWAIYARFPLEGQ